jgi:anti-anti-sigma regulatory factor
MSTTYAMTEVVDSLRGAVHVSGHLTAQGADLLRGTVESLCRGGHRRVLVDMRDVRAADIAGLQVLRDMERDLAADGACLLLHPPAG